ncbi:metallophosphoesterase family protein [Candidatus Micrarchaeota archaeon]|nr:metallophosphoesterase family protein [Candidatus Micrarchaeota archaeon]MBI5177184.1 metallophosphoesterase family protein [Candidatus Micrarchaeota archaeon]
MKLLCFSDAHLAGQAPRALGQFIQSARPDLALAVGDLTTRGPLSYAQELIAVVEEAGVRALAVGGNMDPPEVHSWLSRKGISIHCRRVEVGDFNIVGLGGSLTTPFGTPVEFTEGEIAGMLANAGIDSKTIFAPHNPPLGTCADLTAAGKHVGSKSILDAINKFQPALCVCGHIHEARGTQTLGKTKLVKLPPLLEGKAALVDLPGMAVMELSL